MKAIPGCEGRYSAEEDGRIYSHITRRFLLPGATGSNLQYRQVNLNGKSCLVHILVLTTFRGPAPEGMESRHMDGCGSNNALDNLQWSTHVVNVADKALHGTMVLGERHHACAISDADVARLKARRATGLSFPKLGKEFGISKSQAHRICVGENRRGA